MKTLNRSLFVTLILLAVFSLSSCEKNSGTSKGTARFTAGDAGELSLHKSALADSAVLSYHVMVSVEDMDGNPVLTDELIPVYLFGQGFVSEDIELDAGDYNLTAFLVIDPSGQVIFAAPMEGSPLAYLVIDPLPLKFTVTGGVSTTVMPEVLPVNDHTPGDFGYVSFGIHIVKPLAFWTGCVIDNPMIMAPFPLYTEAKLTVFAGNSWRYSFNLEAGVNHLVIRGGYETYLFLVEKEGYVPLKMWVSARDLAATTRENPLYIKIPWDSNQWKTLVLKPGPEKGKDAMVSNLQADKNFGLHKYFETTYITEPVLTVMRSNESMIWFDMSELPKSATVRKAVLTLYYDIPLPWDSTVVYPVNSSGSVQRFGAVFQQIVEPWEEEKVTWSTRPKTVEAYQVYLWPFVKNANFIDIDVTSLYAPQITTDMGIPYPNYGMYFRLWPEEWSPGFRFASSDHPDPNLWPRLTLFYTLP